MAEIQNPNPAAFPKLDDSQIARVANYGTELQAKAGEILFDQGDSERGVFVVLQGSVEILSVSNTGGSRHPDPLPWGFHRRGKSAFRPAQPSPMPGPRSQPRDRIDRATLQRMMQTDATLGEIFLTAFILRRVFLIANSVGDAILIGSNLSSDSLRLRAFLSRNGHPHTYIDVEREPDIQKVLDHFAIRVTDIPVLICRGQLVLRNPTNAEAAACFGLNAGIDESGVSDLVVIGADQAASPRPFMARPRGSPSW